MLSSFGVDQVRQNKLATLRNILKEREEIALEQRIQIEMFINNIKESDIRQIFEYRYTGQTVKQFILDNSTEEE